MIKKKWFGIVTHSTYMYPWHLSRRPLRYQCSTVHVHCDFPHYMCRSVIIGKEIIYMYFQVHLSLF